MFTAATVFSALELGFIYALVAMALFLSFRILNIADMSTDGTFTLGCAVSATAAVAGHPVLGLFLAIAAGAASGFVTATLQTRLGVDPRRHHHQHGAVHRQPGGYGLFLQRANAENADHLYDGAGAFWRCVPVQAAGGRGHHRGRLPAVDPVPRHPDGPFHPRHRR